MLRHLLLFLPLYLLMLITSPVYAATVVIAHPDNGSQSLSAAQVKRIFLGKSKRFPNGEVAVPINQYQQQQSRIDFDTNLLKKSASQLKAYWSKLVFTGKGSPPKDLGNDDAVKQLIAANPNMIGYIDSSKVDASVKVIYSVN